MYSAPKHRTRTGRVNYIIDHADFPDGLFGCEHWRMTAHEDGHRVLRSYCEFYDKPTLIRDVIQSVDADFHPLDASVRLIKDNKFLGNSWYHFTDTEAELYGYTAGDGRIHDKTGITRAMRGFGTHAVNSDSWLMARFDYSKGPSDQTFKNNLLTSLDHRGATGPAFERTKVSTIRYFGIEKVTVPAGQFDCHHFTFLQTLKDHPPYHLWVTTDGDFLFVKATVTEPYNWSFELVELDGDGP